MTYHKIDQSGYSKIDPITLYKTGLSAALPFHYACLFVRKTTIFHSFWKKK